MSTPDPHRFQQLETTLRAFACRRTDVFLLPAYAAGFALLHWIARPWGGEGFFSLWYPAAGLRFAVLWRWGPRLTPWLMAVELAVDALTGLVDLAGPDAWHDALGVMRPALTCGLVLTVLQRLAVRRGAPNLLPPMIFGLAAVGAPILNALLVQPIQLILPRTQPTFGQGIDLVIALSSLVVGDLLGILVLAPVLLFLDEVIQRKVGLTLPRLKPLALLEGGGALAVSTLVAWFLWRAGMGVQPAPGLLAGAWIGLRFGRRGAWLAIFVQVVMLLPYSAQAVTYTQRLGLHLGLASTVVVTWLAGSYCDAQIWAQASLDRRNRMLFQAERLKTLRAMSVAVIHEISQPLSTLAIEARHLNESCGDAPAEIAASAALVDRKARELSDMVRRLRRFGGRDVDEPSPVQVALLVQTARQIVAPELRAMGAWLGTDPVAEDIFVQAQEVELTQALVNLLRNAMAAHAQVAQAETDMRLDVHVEGGEVCLEIVNAATASGAGGDGSGRGGMGVGLAIARTIVEAHGGRLSRRDAPGQVRFLLFLPIVGASA
ncbi:ATP-binding protein [Novosphingobium terrae]|uniref:ATP-binding protein n=1 Tax=Novosphingobium terrae TaxID=2726189 RepID=UPI00197D5FEE|nr:ATP-binding protein [Novosphingobium terrae]